MNGAVELSYDENLATITLSNPTRRNALSCSVLESLQRTLDSIAASGCRAAILAAEGPVFCAGHDYADMEDRDLSQMHSLLQICRRVMETLQELPQPVIACVQGLATGAGCQLALSCDLIVASTDAAFATPGGKGSWFCTTPMVAVSRAVGAKRALEMLFTGEPVSAETALRWGMINRVVAADKLALETRALALHSSRGSKEAKAIGKRAFYAQIGLEQRAAYDHATEVMAASSTLEEAQRAIAAFLAKKNQARN